jgi:hypothetical protein
MAHSLTASVVLLGFEERAECALPLRLTVLPARLEA